MAKKIVKRVQPTKKVVGKVKKAPPPKKPVSVRKPAPVKAAPKTVVRKKTAASTETQLKVIDKDLVKLLNKRHDVDPSRAPRCRHGPLPCGRSWHLDRNGHAPR